MGKNATAQCMGSPIWLCSNSQWICIVNVSRASLRRLESGFTIHKATCTHRATRRELEISPMKSIIFYILYSQLLTHVVNHCATWDIRKWRHRRNCFHTSRKSYILTLFYFEFTSPSGSLWVIRRERWNVSPSFSFEWRQNIKGACWEIAARSICNRFKMINPL